MLRVVIHKLVDGLITLVCRKDNSEVREIKDVSVPIRISFRSFIVLVSSGCGWILDPFRTLKISSCSRDSLLRHHWAQFFKPGENTFDRMMAQDALAWIFGFIDLTLEFFDRQEGFGTFSHVELTSGIRGSIKGQEYISCEQLELICYLMPSAPFSPSRGVKRYRQGSES